MIWKSVKRKPPPPYKKVWISFVRDRIFTKQEQTSAKVVGKDPITEEFLWHNMETKEMIDNSRLTVTHWMETPDNPAISNFDM